MLSRVFARTYPFLSDGGRIRADDEFLRRGGELGQAADGEIFVVEGRVVVDGIVGLLLSLAGKWQSQRGVTKKREDREGIGHDTPS